MLKILSVKEIRRALCCIAVAGGHIFIVESPVSCQIGRFKFTKYHLPKFRSVGDDGTGHILLYVKIEVTLRKVFAQIGTPQEHRSHEQRELEHRR